MSFKLITLLLCSIMFFAIFASFAAATVDIENLAGNNSSVSHGNSFDISFTIKNNNSQDDFKNITNIKINLPQLISGTVAIKGAWASATVGQQTFEIKNNAVELSGLKILKSSASDVIKLTFATEKYVSQGLYKGGITFSAKLEDQQELTDVSIPPIKVEITIPSSPQLSITQLNPLSLTQNSSLITVNNIGNTRLEKINFNITGNINLTLSQAFVSSLEAGRATSPLTVLADLSALVFGSNTGSITASSSDGTSASTSYSITKTFCINGQKSINLTIEGVDVIDFIKSDKEWGLLDNISIDVEVKNNVNSNVGEVIVEMGLFNENGENIVNDLDFINKGGDKINIGDLDTNDKEVVTFTFKVPADVQSGNYRLTFKAYSDDDGENKVCVDSSTRAFGTNVFFTPIEIKRESDSGKLIALDNIRVSPSEVTCGDTSAIIFDVVNIGNKNQDQVRISLINTELNLDQSFEIKKNLNKGDVVKNQRFTFDVPQGLQDKTYDLELNAEYGYRKDRGTYSDSIDSITLVPLKVIGCRAQSAQSVSPKLADITISPLDASAEAGKDLVISAVIKNIGNKTATFITGIKNYESWASLKTATERIISLSPGESREVRFTLGVNADTKGEQTLLVEAVSDSHTDSQAVKVIFAGEEVRPPLLGGISFKGNTLLWVVGIMNVILLLLIIIVAVRLSRK